MWCITGLGNPGERYKATRHNIGFDLVDRLSSQWKIPVNKKGKNYIFGSGDYNNVPVLLVKPMTYMNCSGDVFRRLLKEPEITCQESLILYDDMNLPLGRIRIRSKGSAGGHNGLRSIVGAAGTDEIPRLRVGIGSPGDGWVDFVLERFSSKEREVINEALDRAVSAVESVLNEGVELAMNRWNR